VDQGGKDVPEYVTNLARSRAARYSAVPQNVFVKSLLPPTPNPFILHWSRLSFDIRRGRPWPSGGVVGVFELAPVGRGNSLDKPKPVRTMCPFERIKIFWLDIAIYDACCMETFHSFKLNND